AVSPWCRAARPAPRGTAAAPATTCARSNGTSGGCCLRATARRCPSGTCRRWSAGTDRLPGSAGSCAFDLWVSGPRASRGDRVEGDRGGRADVEGVDAVRQRDAHPLVGRDEGLGGQSAPFRAEHERHPVHPVRGGLVEGPGLLVRGEGEEGEARLADRFQ